MEVIKSELPSLFPAVEKFAQSNDGLIKIIGIILPIVLFFAAQMINKVTIPTTITKTTNITTQTKVEQKISTEIKVEQNIILNCETTKKPSKKMNSKIKPKKAKKPCE